jgi:hypothetical protein
MGEWSDHFEDFPEEDPGNYVDGVFDPQGAAQARAAKKKLEQENQELRAKLERIANEAKQNAERKSNNK